MSKIGQLLRGLGWYNFRNVDGVLHPDITDDPNKMLEVNFYLDYIKDKDKDKVHKILEKYRLTDLSNPSNKEAKMDEIAKGLDELEKVKAKEPVKEK